MCICTGALNAWTPPPCGLLRPAPPEPFVVRPFVARQSLEARAGRGGGHGAAGAADAGGYGLAARGSSAAGATPALSGEVGWAPGRLSAIAGSGAASSAISGRTGGAGTQQAHASSSSSLSALPAVATEDADAWSDDDEDTAPPTSAVRHRGRDRRGGAGQYNKRRRPG